VNGDIDLIVGAFGNVRVGWLKSNKTTKYAIKMMKKAEIISSKHVDHIENEKLILEKISHPFIVFQFHLFHLLYS
jgi:serine/threonine protein kinase